MFSFSLVFERVAFFQLWRCWLLQLMGFIFQCLSFVQCSTPSAPCDVAPFSVFSQMKVAAVLLLALVASSSVGVVRGQNAIMQKVLFDPASGALCNDGTPGGFYIEQNTSSNDWVIHLQGGYWCYDHASCLARQSSSPAMTGSGTWSPTIGLGGLFSTNATVNPVFATANKVMVGYCSSDSWIGAGMPNSTSLGWYFQGLAIIQELVNVLSDDQYGLTRPGSRVMYTGCSAGGQGVVLTVDRFRDMLPDHVQMWAFADAGWLMNETPLNPSWESLNTQLAGALTLWSGVVSPDCALAQPASPQLCLFSSIAVIYARTPMLIQAAQNDQFQLPYNIGHNPPYANNGAEKAYVAKVQNDFMNSMSRIYSPPHIAFSTGCWAHCLSLDNYSFSQIKISDTRGVLKSLSDTITEMATRDRGVSAIDTCDTWNCNPACPPEPPMIGSFDADPINQM